MNKDIHSQIKESIDKNKVVVFAKGVPDAPQCGFSATVFNILNILKVKFATIDVLENDELRQGIKDYSDWPTIPQLYINQKFVGGCDIVKEMYQSGEIQKLI
jgi:monothiol glutaredoxin